MAEPQRFDFKHDGVTYQGVTAGYIQRTYLPTRSVPWVKRGLQDGATDIAGLVAASERRQREGAAAAKRASLKSPMRGRVLP